MKDSGDMIIVKAKAWKSTLTGTSMKEISKKEKLMEKVSTIGLTEKSMMENGKMELKKAMVCGEVYLEIVISDNGKIVKLMDMEFINGRMGIGMKEVGSTA
jgi:hypothetical protein